MEQLHYYYFVFSETPDGQGQIFTSGTIGLTEPLVSRKVLEAAKLVAGAAPDAVLLNCSYFGHMSSDKFNEGF